MRVDTLRPSALVRRFGSKIADATEGMPVLDVACGSGRNALFLFQLGCTVICIDKDLTRLQTQQHIMCNEVPARLSSQLIDLVKEPWPFSACTVGGIVNVHFLLPKLFPFFESSLSPGGYLILETVPGCGGNYLELPRAGELRVAFGKGFDFELYKERKVGPRSCDAVTVQILARRRNEKLSRL
jgi:SAM-dependent methyltransferase